MSLLSYNELIELVYDGVIDAPIENVNSSSIDLTYHNIILRRDTRTQVQWEEWDLNEKPYWLQPGEFILASSHEYFNLPLDVSGDYRLKSSQARMGLNALLANWMDAGWHGRLTLEFIHHGTTAYKIEAGAKCGQAIFNRHAPVPEERSYRVRGRYNGQQAVTASKGVL